MSQGPPAEMWSVAENNGVSCCANEEAERWILTALALNLDEDGEIGGSLTIVGLEGLEELETVGLGIDGDVDGSTVSRGGLEGVLSGVIATRGELETGGILELEGLAISAGESVGNGVEGQVASKGHGGDKVRGSDESVGGGVSIVTTGEVTVVRGDDYLNVLGGISFIRG